MRRGASDKGRRSPAGDESVKAKAREADARAKAAAARRSSSGAKR